MVEVRSKSGLDLIHGIVQGNHPCDILAKNTKGFFVDHPWSEVEWAVSHTKHIWYSEHGTYCQFEIILERGMSATHIAVILRTRTGPAYEEESMKTDYPDVRNEYGMS